MPDPEEQGRPEVGQGPSGEERPRREPVGTPEAFAETHVGIGTPTGSSDPGAGHQPSAHSGKGGAPEWDDDEQTDPYVGRVLSGVYKVENRIGEGGMGTVYMALHVHLHKPFAVKVLSPKIAADKNAVMRFRQEAIAASSIDHENIVDIVNFDATDDGDVFIVMELLKGKSLAELMEDGPLVLPQALQISYQLCRALGAAHAEGIVHRDLKPENVFIVRKKDGDVAKVLDFGISKVKSAEAESVRMTKTGQLVGTPLYMSPEQARGEADVDRRADIYALGVILYEMLTGTPPFKGSNYFQLLWMHGNEEPVPPRQRAPDAHIPEAVEAAVLKTLAKNPADRFQTMDELEAALSAAAPDVPVPARYLSLSSVDTTGSTGADFPAGRRIGRRMLAVAAVVLLAVGAGLGALAMQTEGASPSGEIPTVHASADPAGEETGEPARPGAAAPSAAEDAPAPAEELPENEAAGLPEGLEPPPDVSVAFDSRPQGAEVRVGDRVVGTTPVSADLPPSREPVEVRFSRRGYADRVVSVVPEDGLNVMGRLRPLRREPRTGGGALPIKKGF